jgi:Undecaprenyl-phosphate galactose phosphotransferase WbaP
MADIGLWGEPVAVLGAGETGRQLVRTLKEEWGLGYQPVGVFDFLLAPRGGVLEGFPYGGTVNDALELARKQRINTVIFAMPHVRRKYIAEFVDRASNHFRQVLIVPNLGGAITSMVTTKDLAHTFGLEIRHNLLDPWARRAKRALDLFGVSVGGLLIIPLLLAIAILIKSGSLGPVFFRQRRLGTEGKYFYCLKFRTMHDDAEHWLTELLKSDPALRAEWEKEHKLRNDPRITRIGRFLRKTSLDELPQLWNVLRGEMSLVGPRPIVNTEISRYEGAYKLYRRVKPGMSGLWQVSGRSDTSYKERVAIDVYYVRGWSIWLDLVILARTVEVVLFRRGAA